MIKKTLIFSLKAIKLSTWLGLIVILLAALTTVFFLFFPVFLKVPIETQLSQLSGMEVKISKIGFDLRHNNIALKIDNVQINSQRQQPVARIEQLYWHIDFFNLFDDVYHPNKFYVDTLTFYTDYALFDTGDLTPILLSNLRFLELLHVNKTLIKNHDNTISVTLSPLTFARRGADFVLTIPEQNIGVKKADIHARLSVEQFTRDGFLKLPIDLHTADFLLSSEAKIYQQNVDSLIEWSGLIERIDAANISQYFLRQWLGKPTHKWLNNAFVSGSVDLIKIKFKQNLSQAIAPEFKLSAHSNNMALLFHPDWQNLQHLDADIVMDTKNIAVQVNAAQLNGLDLKDIQVQIPNFTSKTANIEVMGKIDSDSQLLIDFLSRAPLGEKFDGTLQQFSLSGSATAQVNVIIPLNKNETQPKIDVDLKIKDNRLSTLDGVVVVENYSTDASYHQGRLNAKGLGNIRNNIFEIKVNSSDSLDIDFAVEISKEADNFKAYIAKTAENTWFAEIISPDIKSKLLIDLSQSIPQLNLQNLHVNTQKSGIKALDFQPNDFPNMYLRAKNIRVDDYQFPDFKVDLHSAKNVLNINNLEFDGIGVNQNNLSFNGSWLQGITTLVATAKGKKLSDFLQQLKIQEEVKGGEFDFDLRLFCACNPWNMNLKNISGYASLNVKQGEFSDQDPNIGRVLSLLNVESIAKRLKFEVDDLTHYGFVYDDIQVDAYLNDALLQLERFQVNASSSTIWLSGNSNIVNQQYNILATVRPAISNSVPIATYLAGGGLAGLGVWLADKVLFDGKIMNLVVDSVAEFNYKITGSWDNPVIE